MARAGVPVDEIFTCPGVGSGQVADHLVRLVSGGGLYQAVRVGPDRLQFARSFRPTWATVCGVVGLLAALLGVVFFFVRTTEMCVAVIEEDHRGTRIRLTGRLDREMLEALRAAFADPATAAAAASAAAAVGAPVASAYDRPVAHGGPAGMISATPGSPLGADLRPATSPPGVVAPPPHASVPPPFTPARADEDLPDATRAVSPRAAVPPGRGLVLDDGQRISTEGLVLVGRDPAPRADEQGAHLVVLRDLSVSKTHLAIRSEGSTWWIMDRHSTNGTLLVASDGERPVTPGQWVRLDADQSIRIGERTMYFDGGPSGLRRP